MLRKEIVSFNSLNVKSGRRELAPSSSYRRLKVGHSFAAAPRSYRRAALFLAMRSARTHFKSLNVLMRREGLEPSRVSPYASETYAYTNSATSA